MPISDFGWNDNEAPAISAENLELDRQQIGAYVDASVADIVGPQGPPGPVGPSGGPTGPPGGSFEFLFNSSTTNANPGTGEFALNAAPGSSPTGIYINDTDNNSNALAPWLGKWVASSSANKAAVTIVDVTSSGSMVLQTTGGTANSGWYAFTATTVVENGPINNGDTCWITYSRTGDVGATGATGPAGTSAAAIGTRRFSTTTDTLQLTDNGNRVESLNLSAVTETVPVLASGVAIEYAQIGTGLVTFVPVLTSGTLVQTGSIASGGNGSTTSFSLTLNGVTRGNSIVLRLVSGSSGGIGAFTVSDNVQGQWQAAYAPTTGTYYSHAFWWCPSAIGGNTTITATCPYPPDSGGFSATAMEWPLLYSTDQTPAVATGTGTSGTSTSLTPSQDPEVVFLGGLLGAAPSSSPGSPWTNIAVNIFGSNEAPLAYQTVPSTSAVTGTWSWTGSETWYITALSFKCGTRLLAPGVSLGTNPQISEQYATAGLYYRTASEILLSGGVTV